MTVSKPAARNKHSERLKYSQVLFIFLAFGLMALASFLFGLSTERMHLDNEAEYIFDSIETQLFADMQELETMMGVVSESMRGMLVSGVGLNAIKSYITNITDYGYNSGIPGFLSVFAYFDMPGTIGRTVFSAISPETDWMALEAAGLISLDDRDWYLLAMESGGEIVMTQPYADLVTGDVALAYARAIYDDDGGFMAVVGLNILLDRIYEFSTNTRRYSRNSWMLLDNNLTIIAFPFPEFLGVPLYDAPEIGFADIFDLLIQGLNVSGHRFTDITGENSVVTIRQLDNGWYLGVATPIDDYYANLQSMVWFLLIFGFLMAAGLSFILIRILAGKDKAIAEKNMLANMENIMNGIDVMVYVNVPETGEIVFMNDSMKHHYNITADPVGQLCYEVLQDGQDKKCAFCPCFKLDKNPDDVIVWSEHSTKTNRYYRNTDRYIDWPDGRKMHIQHSVDATELLEAKEAAEMSSRSKSVFLSHISHEIRTPINAVLGTAEIQLQKETNTPDMDEAFNIIYSSGSLLLNIINDLLDLSKAESGKLELMPIVYEIPSLVYDTMQLNLMRYESKPIDFKLKIDENTPYDVFGDELRIKQVLINILSNAFKYTDTGEIELSLSAETQDGVNDPDARSACTLIFRVSDTGQGMNQDQIGRLFEEYTRFNMNTNRTTVGTGLGMTITKRLLDMMNGEIDVKSEPGKGSVFTVRLPQERIGTKVCGAEMAEKLRTSRFHSMLKMRRAKISHEYMPYGKVLIVDDVESNLYVAKSMMMPYGLTIETATSGFEAVNRIKSGITYDVVFMDHMMPKMDGIEAVSIIRDLGYNQPIIALTANAITGQAEMFLGSGFDGYISKPIDMRELNVYLNRFVRDKQLPEVIAAARHKMGHQKFAAGTPSEKQLKEDLLAAFVLDIESSLTVLEDLYSKLPDMSDGDIELYVTTVHGLKSALRNVGEMELSEAALKLENAGDGRRINEITADTPVFINNLKAIIENNKPNVSYSDTASEDDMVYLRHTLAEIKKACESIKKSAAKAALDKIRKRAWPKAITELLDEISVYLLHGEFKKVVAVIDKSEF
jgi:signal transduction histidine kinase/CheY-like chemotaxis protein